MLTPTRETDTAPLPHRAEREGFGELSWTELVELLTDAATRRALGSAPLSDVAPESCHALSREFGVAAQSAVRLAAAFELGRRVELSRRPDRARLDCPAEVHRRLAARVRGADRESFFVLALDGKHALIREHCVSVGSLNSSLVHPREVFRPAIQSGAAAVVCAHNHPSGDPEPSAEDLVVTRRLAECGRLLGIPLLDHVVLGDARYVSLRERINWT